jgi:hypothetical protein
MFCWCWICAEIRCVMPIAFEIYEHIWWGCWWMMPQYVVSAWLIPNATSSELKADDGTCGCTPPLHLPQHPYLSSALALSNESGFRPWAWGWVSRGPSFPPIYVLPVPFFFNYYDFVPCFLKINRRCAVNAIQQRVNAERRMGLDLSLFSIPLCLLDWNWTHTHFIASLGVGHTCGE